MVPLQNIQPIPRASSVGHNHGTVATASPETRASMKTSASLHGCKVMIRVGAAAGTPGRARVLLASLLSGLHVTESAGVALRLAPGTGAGHSTKTVCSGGGRCGL